MEPSQVPCFFQSVRSTRNIVEVGLSFSENIEAQDVGYAIFKRDLSVKRQKAGAILAPAFCKITSNSSI